MCLHFLSSFPLRFSGIFRTQHTRNAVNLDVDPRFQCFVSDITIRSGTLDRVELLIAGNIAKTALTHNRAYRIDGEVGVGGRDTVSILFKDAAHTISFDHAAVDLSLLCNKVSAQGIGQIVDWSRRSAYGGSTNVEVIRVHHRSLAGNPVVFAADYILTPYMTLPLCHNALAIGNIISLRGHVIGHNMENNIWEIERYRAFIAIGTLDAANGSVVTLRFLRSIDRNSMIGHIS
ncbi:uncharacterized protein MELLADRAFT_92022 [Melampsora larici-populina 98AG31]|uniref:Uncharacterized protein n=1 Tax=Melampsora larici-populina (strain 98AG31 / pathotype 3-4-7) TaxID=747676 RepID=F4S189_MELLP|nr:uncharacterized protein MELLADRAFT_92022 [Melampsora larici-populina 98AG31]EGG01523.1 hypothetical protein MELLADRAFT_92022 [Melampsora larici-populina 98AG31]